MVQVDTAMRGYRARRALEIAAALREIFDRMRPDVAARWEAGVGRIVARRWDLELAETLLAEHMVTAGDVAARIADAFDADVDPEVMRGWLAEHSRIVAELVNAGIAERVAAEDEDDDEGRDPVTKVFGQLEESGSMTYAVAGLTTVMAFAARDTAKKVGASAKTWRVNSGNPRSSHRRVSGETVALGEVFSNRMQGPGDPAGGVDETAGCRCSLTIVG